MKQIPLTQGQFALVDDEDFAELSKHKWCAQKVRYGGFVAARGGLMGEQQGKRTTILMHRVIMDCPKNMDVDHQNHNTLFNCRSNLRICERTQNLQNQRPVRGGSSQHKGVCWNKENRNWRVLIQINKRRINLGSFDDETEAAMTYDQAAIKHFGEYAHTNF